jgi:hypothetical protein
VSCFMTSIVLLVMIGVRLTACWISRSWSGMQFIPDTSAGTYAITINAMSSEARLTSTITLKVM